MSRHPAPDENWGRDNSDSLVLTEQSKALPEKVKDGAVDTTAREIDDKVKAAVGKSQGELLDLLTEAERQGSTFLQTYVNPARERSYKAFRNEHFGGSKYLSARYKTRSKLFKPKTRNAVRKAQAAAAGALFASADVVSITAQDNSDPRQRASADLKMELLNYRLDRTGTRDGIPWFLVSMGAHQDALIAGVCCTKQYWKYRERVVRGGDDEQDPEVRISVDRPDCLSIAPENVVLDPNCEWTRPAQTSAYFIVRYPMPIHEVLAMMRPTEGRQDGAWIAYEPEELMGLSGMSPEDVDAIRSARSSGADVDIARRTAGTFRTLWVYENFITIDGEDWTFWSVGNQKLLSTPVPTYEAYPALFGDRPYTLGFGALEAHRPIPMAPVESWQQLQQEANDVTNLRLDQMKQVVTPVTKVKRGRMVDIEQVMRRGQDTVLMVNDLEDVEFDRPPDVPPSAMAEGNVINNDFDELAGTFSQGSVQSNRSLNETVGGMKLLAGGANAVTEFDLRVWVETWVQPTLWQLVKLEEYYENDEKILALAGQKAELIEKYGIDTITDHLLMEDITLQVSAGIGAADPMQSLEKFQNAAGIVGNIIMPFIQAGLVSAKPKVNEIVDEVFGKAGYKGAFDRFFEEGPPPQQGPQQPPVDPIKQAELQLKGQIADKQNQLKQLELQLKTADAAAKHASAESERQLKLQLAELQHQYRLIEAHQSTLASAGMAQADRSFQASQAAQDQGFQFLAKVQDQNFQSLSGAQDRAHQAQQADADRTFQGQQADKSAMAQRREGLAQRTAQAQEADAGRNFQADQTAQDQQFQADQSAQDLGFQADQAQAARDHTSQEAAAGRQQQTTLAKLAARSKPPQQQKPGKGRK